MDLSFRQAQSADLPAIVAMLADDPLGRTRETAGSPLPGAYFRAFEAIDADPNNQLVVAIADAVIVGVLQLTLIPNLTYRGGWRAQIEGVRVHRDRRGQGIGQALLEWAVDQAREHGCRLVQLTTDRERPEALAFYERLGFAASHVGLKLDLKDRD